MALPFFKDFWARIGLACRIMAVVGITMLLAGILQMFIFIKGEIVHSTSELSGKLHDEMDIISTSVKEQAIIGDYASIQQILKDRVKRTNIATVTWTDSAGIRLTASNSGDELKAPQWFARLTSLPVFEASDRISVGGRYYGQLHVKLSITNMINHMWGMFKIQVLAIFAAVVISFLGILMIVRVSLKSLSSLVKGARKISDGDYSVTVYAEGSPEMTVLVKAFNRMVADLGETIKKAEDENEKTLAIIAGIGEGISIQDIDYKVMYQNKVHKDLIGEHVGEYCYEGYEKQSALCEGCALALSFLDGLVHRTERAVSFPDGMRYFDITTSPIKDSSGKIVAGVEAVRDVTEQKLARAALEAEKERLAVTLRSIGDGVIVTDTSGAVTLLNKEAEKLTGWRDDEARGRPLSEVFNIINETTREKCENPVDQVLKTGLVVGLANHTALIKRDGTEIIIADSAAPINDRQSCTIGIVLVFRDVTAQYRMEQEMYRMQKIESLGVLAGGLAHDFNNLLTSIIGNLSLAKMYTGVDHQAFQRLSEAEKAAQRATGLTYQLLTFAKGGVPIKKTAGIVEIVKEAVNFALSGSNIKCIYTIPPELWSVEVDKGQMSQVFNNLIINAMHAMPNGGTVRISFKNNTISAGSIKSLSAGDYVEIAFRDEGEGIPEEIIGKIFEPYFTTKKSGSGLGLATAFSILTRHNGHITVESRQHVGTIFHIYIPAIRDTVSPETEETHGLQSGHGRVLLMDDEPMIRSIGGKILNALGYEAGFAKDGEEALKIYQQAEKDHNPFDIVIMDLTIPGGMGGKEAVRKLLELAPQAKVVVSSGYSNDPIMADYRKYGFCGVITKPYSADQVSEVLSRMLRQNTA